IDPTIAARLSGDVVKSSEDQRILDLMAGGQGYAEMAAELGTTQENIDRMVTTLFQRLADQAGRGASAAVDELKRLHAAVVDRETSTRTLRSFVPSQLADRVASGALDMELQE